jgi:hypothetical protein
LPQPERVAEVYDEELREFVGSAPPAFGVQLLGIGVEGHTASLFPASPVLEETRRSVAAVEAPANPPRRLTLTLAVDGNPCVIAKRLRGTSGTGNCRHSGDRTYRPDKQGVLASKGTNGTKRFGRG